MSDNRIEKRLKMLEEKGEKAFITYITAGFPDMEKTKELIRAQEEAGCDVIELGIPFSDPIADGPVIQQASYEAILNGASLKKTFVCMKELRAEGVEIPIVFMLYYNTLSSYGIKAFAKTCNEAGVDGVIVPDLPYEEQDELQEALDCEDGTILLQLISPVSKERVPMLVEKARGFVYCVSAMGVTGQSADFHKEVMDYLSYVKEQSKVPVMMGFGIRTAKDVAPMRDIIDGVIVGTYFIDLLKKNDFDTEVAKEYIRNFKKELNAL